MSNRIRIKFHTFFFVATLFFGDVFFVSASTLSFTPSSGSFNMGKNFTVSVTIDAAGESVNSSEAEISFDKTILNVQSISKDGSPFGMWPSDPVFNNSTGVIKYTGGATSPFTTKKNILSIVFKPMKEGTAEVSFSSSSASVMAGPGTEVLTGKTSATFTISAPSVTEDLQTTTPPVSTGGGSANLPAVPTITSNTHPDTEQWYKENTALFKWNVSRDVDNVRILLDDNAKSVPSLSNTPPITEKEYKEIADGTKYFHVMFHNKSGWGTPAHRKLLIDSTPPDKFTIESRSDTPNLGDTSLVFLVTDKSSGVDHYELTIDEGASTALQTKDVSSKGEYKLETLSEGEHSVKVRAFDKVGNMTQAELTFTVAKPIPVVAATGDQIVVEGASPMPYWVSFIFLALAVFLAGMMYSERRKFAREKEELKTESDEVGEKLGKIFTALRDEAEEQIRALSGKPNLSDSEREILERLKEALDLSEELLEKEVEDVRKLLR